MSKQAIIDNFGILADYYEQEYKMHRKPPDNFRRMAYQNAVRALQALDMTIITSVKQLDNVKGIGKESRAKIQEFIDTGHIRKAQEVKELIRAKKSIVSQHDSVLALFQTVYGVGPSQAEKFWLKGMRTLDDLRANPTLLNRSQLIGLKYYDDLHTRIPHYYIYIFQLMCRYVLSKEFGLGTYKMECAGSYRRGTASSGDVDFLVTSTKFNLSQIVGILRKYKIIVETLSGQEKEKFMGIAHCPGDPNGQYFHLDIVFLPEDEWGAGLLYFTGSQGFNISMRSQAKKQGYTLNQHGLFEKDGERVSVYTEKEIMSFLGIPWTVPEKR